MVKTQAPVKTRQQTGGGPPAAAFLPSALSHFQACIQSRAIVSSDANTGRVLWKSEAPKRDLIGSTWRTGRHTPWCAVRCAYLGLCTDMSSAWSMTTSLPPEADAPDTAALAVS